MSDVIDWRREPLQGTPEDLEALLEREPENLRVRAQLVWHYLHRFFAPEDQARRNAHLLWLITHHPELELDALGGIDANLWPEAYEEGKHRWLSIVADRPHDPIILRNASLFLSSHDRGIAEDLLRRGSSLEPEVAHWRRSLGFLRALAWYKAESDEERRHIAREAMIEYEQALALEALESPPRERLWLLVDLARTASWAGQHERAAEIAQRVLADVNELDLRCAHHAHAVLGICALAGGDVAGARARLAAASATSARFGAGEIFGPDFTLAKALLARGERDAVIDYLVACKRLWRDYERELDGWRQRIESGDTPSFRIVGPQPPRLSPIGRASEIFPRARKPDTSESE